MSENLNYQLIAKKWDLNFFTLAVDLATGKGEIYEGEPKSGKAGVTLTLDDENMSGLVTGKLNPQQVSCTHLTALGQ